MLQAQVNVSMFSFSIPFLCLHRSILKWKWRAIEKHSDKEHMIVGIERRRRRDRKTNSKKVCVEATYWKVQLEARLENVFSGLSNFFSSRGLIVNNEVSLLPAFYPPFTSSLSPFSLLSLSLSRLHHHFWYTQVVSLIFLKARNINCVEDPL